LVVSALLDVDFESALDEDLVSGLWELEDARAAVDQAREREPLIVAAIDRSDVLPARWANHPLRHVASAPLSAARREGVSARVRSPPWPLPVSPTTPLTPSVVQKEVRKQERIGL
jgi:hypothetical protein